MHLAILMTNTDESHFAAQWPRDCQKFEALVSSVRPSWRFSCFSVKDGIFPEDPTNFDGWIVTGSPASVHDQTDWIVKLQALISDRVAAAAPIFGACFGHQVIAQALGGQVEKSPSGWALGVQDINIEGSPSWAEALPSTYRLYAAHVEQVTKLPIGAENCASSQNCPLAGFRIGSTVFTTQYHPEMRPEFFAALVGHLEQFLPVEAIANAKATLAEPVSTSAWAETIARFFENAVS